MRLTLAKSVPWVVGDLVLLSILQWFFLLLGTRFPKPRHTEKCAILVTMSAPVASA